MEVEVPVAPTTGATVGWNGLLRRLLGAWRRFGAYLLVGATGVGVNLVVFLLVTRFVGTELSAVLIASTSAFFVATSWNFTWNYLWTFQGRQHRRIEIHFGLYAGIQLLSLGINLGTLAVLTWLHQAYLVGQFSGIALGSVWGFTANGRWNFVRASEGPEPVIAARR
ncbi:MAG: GtrA family protein [Thermoplasmata archaeon]|nr:GtrA family protein [Thermoplasmata archaeon]